MAFTLVYEYIPFRRPHLSDLTSDGVYKALKSLDIQLNTVAWYRYNYESFGKFFILHELSFLYFLYC